MLMFSRPKVVGQWTDRQTNGESVTASPTVTPQEWLKGCQNCLYFKLLHKFDLFQLEQTVHKCFLISATILTYKNHCHLLQWNVTGK